MNSNLVLTIISDDKPGLVESLAKTISKHNGNWLESNMSQLAGKFAGILRVSVPQEDAESLISELDNLDDDLKLLIEHVKGNQEEKPSQTFELSLVGNDRPGIISEISHVLAAKKVNVENLHSECQPTPISGDMLFKATLILNAPTSVSLEDVQAELESLADDLLVEIQISAN